MLANWGLILRVADKILRDLYSVTKFNESKSTGYTGYDPVKAVMTLHGNEIVGLCPGGYFPVQWIDLCGYSTSLTLRRINSVLIPSARVYRKSNKVFLNIRRRTSSANGHVFEVPNSGRVPVGELITIIIGATGAV